MPTYDYSCRACGEVREIVCRIADRPEVIVCEKCGGEVRQDMTGTKVQCDDPVNVPWLREFCSSHNRQGGKRDRFGDKPLESRTEYKQYLNRHDLRSADGENLSEF